MRKNSFWAVLALSMAATPLALHAQDSFPGPYFGKVTRVIDGDTLVAEVSIWPTIAAEISVRIRGIDAPETHRPECEEERYYGDRAKVALEAELERGTRIRLENVVNGSFAGRVIADVFRQNEHRGTPIDTQLLRTELVKRWTPGDTSIDWCAEFEVTPKATE